MRATYQLYSYSLMLSSKEKQNYQAVSFNVTLKMTSAIASAQFLEASVVYNSPF